MAVGKSCVIRSIPGMSGVFIPVWSVVLQWDGRYCVVLVSECVGECVAAWRALDANITVDKVVVRGL